MGIILIVDDVRTDRELIGKVVSATGNHPEFAEDGKEAIEKAKALAPALILMDVVMPKQDGFSACRQLKKEPLTAGIPIVLVTSKGQASDKFWGERQGADSYIVKPFTWEEVSNVIKQFVPSSTLPTQGAHR